MSADRLQAVVSAWRRAGALLFDFDGVLALSEPFHRAAYNRALAPHGRSIPPEEYWEFFTSKGEGIRGQIRRHAPAWDDLDPSAVDRDKQRIFQRFCETGAIPLHPRAARLIARLQTPDRPWTRPFTIASNTPRAMVEAMLRAGGAPVPGVVGGDGLPIKPAPDIFLAAARSVGVPPERCLVFEDTEKGLRAAAAGGIPAVLVRTPENRDLVMDVPTVAGVDPLEVDGLDRLLDVMEGL